MRCLFWIVAFRLEYDGRNGVRFRREEQNDPSLLQSIVVVCGMNDAVIMLRVLERRERE